jgi:hypothetical protein
MFIARSTPEYQRSEGARCDMSLLAERRGFLVFMAINMLLLRSKASTSERIGNRK